MDIKDLGQNRFLIKDPDQSDQTKDVAYVAINPKPPVGANQKGKQGQTDSSSQDAGAPNILTGTVIVACFIQTSALPSRVEMQGNDITFYDDTTSRGGEIVGDTSRLVFTHASGKSGEVISQGFILEKRASIRESYDNVISWYATPPKAGYHNNMFIGRNGGLTEDRNLHSLYLGVRKDINALVGYPTALNGVFAVEYSEEVVLTHATQRPFMGGSSAGVLADPSQLGYSALMSAGDGGGLYWVYKNPMNPDQWITIMAADNTGMVITVPVSFSGGIALSSGPKWVSGTGSPEGVVTAPIGSLYSNLSGGASTTLYVKTSGSGNTGWTAK